MYDLLYLEDQTEYNRVNSLLLERWPEASVEDASDYLHLYRLSVDIDGVEEDDFYLWLLTYEFAFASLGLNFMELDNPRHLLDLLKRAKVKAGE